MPSPKLTQPWDFSAALELLHALTPSKSSPPSPPRIQYDGNPSSLGDFDRLWKHLGRSIDVPAPRLPSDTSLSESYSSTPSSTLDDSVSSPPDDIDTEPKLKGVRWNDDVEGEALDEEILDDGEEADFDDHTYADYASRAVQLRKTHPKSGPKRSKPKVKQKKQRDSFYMSEVESELDPPDQQSSTNRLKSSIQDIDAGGLTSITESPQVKKLYPSPYLPTSLPPIRVDKQNIYPIDTLTPFEKRSKLILKLLDRHGVLDEHRSLLAYTMPPSPATFGQISESGLHVFIDYSNINIGFCSALKKARGYNVHSLCKQPPFSFSNFALILERGRRVTRRVLAGSTVTSHSGTSRKDAWMIEARQCGYELNILERVSKFKESSLAKKRSPGSGNGYLTSGQSSGSEATYLGPKVMAEQGVDELLHMKFLESLIDFGEPSTIILASGDAAEAEYSGGFFKNVERALQRGWKVELTSWKDNLSRAYLSRDFLKKWDGQFRIIELDDFSEDLLAAYAPNHWYSHTFL